MVEIDRHSPPSIDTWHDANHCRIWSPQESFSVLSVAVVLYQNYGLSWVRTKLTKGPDAIPKSVPFDHALAIKAFASTNPPRLSPSVGHVVLPSAYNRSARGTAAPPDRCDPLPMLAQTTGV